MRASLFFPTLSLAFLTTMPVDPVQALQTRHAGAPREGRIQGSWVAPKREPDCSFGSAATCWTLTGRFPPPRRERRDSVPADLLKPPPASLASEE
jgi:hypothetical protein